MIGSESYNLRYRSYGDAVIAPSDAQRFWAKVRRASGDGCWLWTASRSGGRRGGKYGQFTTTVNGQQTHVGAHVFAYVLHYGPVPEGLEVMHACNTGLCVRPDHLTAGTHRQNVQDASRDGLLRVPRPSRHKVSDADCEEMVRLVLSGRLRSHVAAQFDVSKTFVTLLMKGERRQLRQRPALRRAG